MNSCLYTKFETLFIKMLNLIHHPQSRFQNQLANPKDTPRVVHTNESWSKASLLLVLPNNISSGTSAHILCDSDNHFHLGWCVPIALLYPLHSCSRMHVIGQGHPNQRSQMNIKRFRRRTEPRNKSISVTNKFRLGSGKFKVKKYVPPIIPPSAPNKIMFAQGGF